jgi:hypothetical protein
MFKISRLAKVVLGIVDITAAIGLGYVAIFGNADMNWWTEWGTKVLLILLVFNGAVIFLESEKQENK